MSRTYLLDEHLPRGMIDQLQRRAPTVTVRMVGDTDAPPKGTPDPELLLWCEREGVTLVTNNRASMPEHLRAHVEAGGRVLGLFTLRRGHTVWDMLDDLVVIALAGSDTDFVDRIIYLPFRPGESA